MRIPGWLTAGVSGVMFGVGLSVSGMTNPAKVIGFLDIAGRWDPSLAFVMGGALLPALLGFNLGRREGGEGCRRARCGKGRITWALLGGSVLFGVGWGLGGFCPGPALVGLVAGEAKVVVFVAAMFAGMGMHRAMVREGVQEVLAETEGARSRE